MDQSLQSLLKAMITTLRPKRDQVVGIRLLQISSEIPAGHSARMIQFGRACANELEWRARRWLLFGRRVLGETRTPWSKQNAQEVEVLLTEEISADLEALNGIYGGRFPGIQDIPSAPGLSAAYDLATATVRNEIQLLVLREETGRLPLTEQLAAPRYAAVFAAWKEANERFDQTRDEYKPVVLDAVAAVEQLSRLFVGQPTFTLGDALRDMRKTGRVPAPLLKGIEELWAWSSGEPGVRHGAAIDVPVDAVQARYVLTLAEAALLLLLARDTE